MLDGQLPGATGESGTYSYRPQYTEIRIKEKYLNSVLKHQNQSLGVDYVPSP